MFLFTAILIVVLCILYIFKSEQALNDRFTLLNDLTTKASYYDDMLTITSNTFALSGDNKWRDRYQQYEEMIHTLLNKSSGYDKVTSDIIQNLNDANNALIEMEKKSLLLSDQGQQSEALEILDSTSYKTHKKMYLNAMNKAKQVLSESSSQLIHQNTLRVMGLLLLIFLAFLVVFCLWYYFKRYITQTEKNIQYLMRFDQLSGLLNRKVYDQDIYELYRGLDNNSALSSISIINIDNFKAYNLHYGLQEGDKVIEQVGLVIQQTVNGLSESAYRISDDEFAIINQGNDKKQSIDLINAILHNIEMLNMPNEHNAPFDCITASAGMSFSFDHLGNDLKKNLHFQASKATERAKKDGRNTLVIH